MNSGFDLTFRTNGPALPLSAAEGGTGQTSYAVGDILAATAATTLGKVALGAAGTRLRVNSGATSPEWARQDTSAKTANYTTVATDSIIFCSTNAFTVTLITPVGNGGLEQTIVKTDASLTAIITVTGTGLSTTLNTQGESIRVVSDGTNWQLVVQNIPAATASYTPTVTFSNNTPTGFWRRERNSITCDIYVVMSSTSGVANFSATLPTGLSIDTAKLPTPLQNFTPLGIVSLGDVGVNTYFGWSVYDTTTTVRAVSIASAAGVVALVTNAAPFTFNTGDTIRMRFTVPVSGWNG